MVSVRAAELRDEVAKLGESEKFQGAAQKAEQLLKVDKLEEANAAYTAAYPEQEATAAEAFVLGNTFFTMDDPLARKYHAIALKALPDEPLVNLEWAIDLHREGKAAEAVRYYQKFIKTAGGNTLSHTLLADCLIRIGDLTGAIKQWELADHPHNHTGIDFAIHTIYGKASPFRRRNDLLKTIQGGDLSKLDDLMYLSSAWDRDWWNIDTQKELLEKDLALARKLLKDSPAHLAELELYAETLLRDEVAAEWIKEQLIKNQWLIGDASKLPANEIVLDRLLILVLEHKLEQPKTLVQRFEKELRERGNQSVTALNTLAALLVEAGDGDSEELAAIDKIGWEKHGDARFAASLLVYMEAQNKLKSDSELLQKARKQFPEDGTLELLSLQMAEKEKKDLKPFLIEMIKAEFRHLSKGSGVIKDSYTLKRLFGALEKALRDA